MINGYRVDLPQTSKPYVAQYQLKYIKEVIDIICTPNQKIYTTNFNLLQNYIETNLTDHQVKPNPQDITFCLGQLRSTQQQLSITENEMINFYESMYQSVLVHEGQLNTTIKDDNEEGFYSGSNESLKKLARTLLPKHLLFVYGLIQVCKQGCAYKRKKKRRISEQEFNKEVNEVEQIRQVNGKEVEVVVQQASNQGFFSSMMGWFSSGNQPYKQINNKRKEMKKIIKQERKKRLVQQKLQEMVNPYANDEALQRYQEEEEKQREEFRKLHKVKKIQRKEEEKQDGDDVIHVKNEEDEARDIDGEEKEEKVEWIFNDQVKSKKKKYQDFKSVKALYSNYVGANY